MSAPHSDLDLRALLKLSDASLEAAIRQRATVCELQAGKESAPKFMFLRRLDELITPSEETTTWGEAYFPEDEVEESSGSLYSSTTPNEDYSQAAVRENRETFGRASQKG